MVTEKKNQHFIPKFYLRNFSYQGNQNQIGLHNYDSGFTHQTAKLKTQGSRNFFYGKDGKIEDILSDIEGQLATTIKQIILDEKPPIKGSQNHHILLYFIALTHLRNPISINHILGSREQLKKQLKLIYPDTDTNHLVPPISHDEAISLTLSGIPSVIETMLDLSFKVLKNQTSNPFITSDFPIIKYNQFLELKKWNYSKTGYGVIGLQIFIPLNNELCIVFFDPAIYKVGNKKDHKVIISDKKDIDVLNTLQFTNCLENVYFSDKASIDYIKELKNKSEKFGRANFIESRRSILFEEGKVPDTENLIIMGTTENEINLKVEWIKIHSIGKKKQLSNSVAQLRDWPLSLMKNKIPTKFQ